MEAEEVAQVIAPHIGQLWGHVRDLESQVEFLQRQINVLMNAFGVERHLLLIKAAGLDISREELQVYRDHYSIPDPASEVDVDSPE